jgi:transcriptional regulator with XRE-family HTH domain
MENQFGDALREKRRLAGVSQRELADRVNVDFSYISKVETGRLPPPSADKIVEICLVLEIEPAELLALIGKLPTNVQRAVGTNEVAQVFARGTTDGSVGSRMERIGSFVKKAAG